MFDIGAAYSESAVELAQDADLLIHEATFSHVDSDMAFKKKHSTSTMAAQTAAEAGVKRLVLTHLSPRYVQSNPVTPHDLLSEARSIFPNTEIAEDFMTMEVSSRKKSC